MATETLKNLVLPGLGRFTVLDGNMICAEDLGNNFFVRPADLGRPRAEAVTELLLEMNPEDCVGTAVVADPSTVITNDPAFFTGFTLVIATQLPPAPLAALAATCWAARVPLLALRSVGYLGSLRLQLQGHEVVDSKPDTLLHDLRMATPFTRLQAHCDGYDLAGIDDKDHAHVP